MRTETFAIAVTKLFVTITAAKLCIQRRDCYGYSSIVKYCNIESASLDVVSK